jgi:hypothetical protein
MLILWVFAVVNSEPLFFFGGFAIALVAGCASALNWRIGRETFEAHGFRW